MNIMNRLTRQHMAASRRRTLMTILGVIVSVAMITAVSIGAASFKRLFQEMNMQDDGYWHAKFSDVTAAQASRLEKADHVDHLFMTRELMYGKLAEGTIQNGSKPYLYVAEYGKEAFSGMSLQLVEGRFAENAQEIVISRHLIKNGKVELAVGDTLTVTLGRRYVEENGERVYLNQRTPYLGPGGAVESEEEEGEEEQFEEVETRTYTVVGIVERPNYIVEDYYAPGYSVFTYLDADSLSAEETVNVRLFFDKVKSDFYKEVEALAAKEGIPDDDISYNTNVLHYYGVFGSNDFVILLRAMELILIAIIMVGSVSLIYNSFAISITERSKQFGMLSSVGATRKQKRNAVLYEGAVIGGIAVPLGLLFGSLGMAVTFRVVQPLLNSGRDREVPLRMCVSFSTLLVATGFSVLTIFLSAYLPARRASRISAIEAIRQTQDIRLTRKAVKTARPIRLLFGLPGEIALKNMKRNRKRYRAMVISLLISLVLFTAVGSYVFYMNNLYSSATDDGMADIMVHFDHAEMDSGLFSSSLAVNGVKQGAAYTSFQSLEISPEVTEVLTTKEALALLEKQYRNWGASEEDIQSQLEEYTGKGNPGVRIRLVMMEDAAYAAYAKSVGAKEAPEGEIGGIMLNWSRTKENGVLFEAPLLSVSEGERLKLAYTEREYDETLDETTVTFSKETSVYLSAVTKERPYGQAYSSLQSAVSIYFPRSQWERITEQLPEQWWKHCSTAYYFQVKPDADSVIEENLKKVLDEQCTQDYSIYNRIASERSAQQMELALSIFAYGFIVLISLICVANLCNTISTSFVLRRREFAMLKSIGMEPKSFRRMIRFESLFYGLKALLYGIPLSLLISYGMHRMMTNNSVSLPFTLPWHIYGIGFTAVLLVVFVAMGYSSRKIKDESIVDGLKSEVE